MPEWLVRDYLARRGHARYPADQVTPSRCPLLGYSLQSIRIEGRTIPRSFLQVDQQPEVGVEAYDAGAAMLREFFHQELRQYLQPELDPMGRAIIETCLTNGTAEDYRAFIPEDDV